MNRHQQRKATTHQNLVNAARAVISEKGYNNVDILDITEQANVSKATFYKHFPNKEACVRELMQQGFDALVEELLGSGRPVPVTPDFVRHSFERVFAWAEDNREFLLIMVGGQASSHLNVFGRNYMAEIIERALVHDFPGKSTDPLDSAEVKAQIITGIMIQLLGWWLENDTGYSPSDMAVLVQDVLRDGLRLPQRESYDL
jgi:AcrR family transcriptional regulator